MAGSSRPTTPTATGPPYLVPVLEFRRELLVRGLVLGGVVTALWFWVWWLTTGHGKWNPPTIVVTALLAWVFALPAYFLFFVCRMTRPNPAVSPPNLRVAMIVTKVPSEPWPLLRQTLAAMATQDFPRRYDVWLADENPSAETRRWCAANKVSISSRFEVEDYHRPSWPRRTRTKEGNLAYFYDHFGYRRYDIVVQLDADHVPEPTYLAAMVRPFADPKVGYVAAPSICDRNIEDGWTVRGRLYREATLHGPVQAGSNGGWGPVCIGSHYAVRTAALRAAGGIGPELAEDFSTSLWLQSGGWDGVFTIDAEAHGDGPSTFDEMMTQELQWARSLGTILVRWAPVRLRTVPARARLRLGFALLFYPVQGLALFVAAAAPVVGVLVRGSWGSTSLAGFYLHLWPNSLITVATVAYLRRRRILRPTTTKLWSWELVLFQLVRWPWNLVGFAQGMYAGARSREVSFRVTSKAGDGPKPLSARFLVPTLLLGAVPGWVAILVRHPGDAFGLQLLTAIQAATYLVCAWLVVVLHLDANRRRAGAGPAGASNQRYGTIWRNDIAAVVLTAVVVGPTMAGLVWRFVIEGATA